MGDFLIRRRDVSQSDRLLEEHFKWFSLREGEGKEVERSRGDKNDDKEGCDVGVDLESERNDG